MAQRRDLSLVRRNNALSPVREISHLYRDINRLFDNFLSPLQSPLGEWDELGVQPSFEIDETADQYLVHCDMPGMSKDDIKIEVRGNQLFISGERKREEKKDERGNLLTTERYYGNFQRAFTLASDIDSDKVNAEYENGVLHLQLPKAESSRARQIPIREVQKQMSHQKKQGKSSQEEAA